MNQQKSILIRNNARSLSWLCPANTHSTSNPWTLEYFINILGTNMAHLSKFGHCCMSRFFYPFRFDAHSSGHHSTRPCRVFFIKAFLDCFRKDKDESFVVFTFSTSRRCRGFNLWQAPNLIYFSLNPIAKLQIKIK